LLAVALGARRDTRMVMGRRTAAIALLADYASTSLDQ
jgi:hypothetical protein